MARTHKCLCATGVFLFLYSIAGAVVGRQFLNYYSQQLAANSQLDLDLQPCPAICGYSYTREKPNNYCCDFYLSRCKYKAECQQQLGTQYSVQLTIYKVVFGISLTYMGGYSIYQMYQLILAPLCSCLLHSIARNRNAAPLTASEAPYLSFQNGPETETERQSGGESGSEGVGRSLESGKAGQGGTVCSICLEGYEGKGYGGEGYGGEGYGGGRQGLKCGHGFHSGCIKRWVRVKKNCPVCRRGVGEKGRFV